MTAKFFLVVNANGTVRAVKNQPDLKFNEVSVAVSLQLPYALFQKPQLSASIVIPDEVATAPQIDAEVSNNVREAIETATGLQVRLTVEPPEL